MGPQIHFLLWGIRTSHNFVYEIFFLISFFFSFFFQYLAEIYITLFFSTFISVKKIFTIRGGCGYVCYCRNLSLIFPRVELAGQKKKKKRQKRDSKPGPEARMIPLDLRP